MFKQERECRLVLDVLERDNICGAFVAALALHTVDDMRLTRIMAGSFSAFCRGVKNRSRN